MPPFFLLVPVGRLSIGFGLSERSDRMNAIGLAIPVLCSIGLLWLRAVRQGPWQGAAVRSIHALERPVGQGFPALFENTEERLGIRIAGVFTGPPFATAAIVLLKASKPSAAARPSQSS